MSLDQIVEMELSVSTNSSGAIYGTTGADLLDGQGIDTLLGGNGGGDTFVFNPDYGTLEISENDPANMASDVLRLGPGITASDITTSSDAEGDLILHIADGSNDTIKLDKMLSDPEWGVSSVQLSDGTNLTRQQLTAMADTGSTENTSITALLPGAQIDPAGYAHSVTSDGGNSTIIYNSGYGALEINLRDPILTYANTLSFGPGILPSDVSIGVDSSGNIILAVGNAGDVITLDAMALGPNNGVQRVLFSDGTTWSSQQILSQISLNLTDYYGSANFSRGDGAVQVSGMGLAGVQLGPDISPGDVYLQSDASGDLVLRLRDDATDSLTITNYIYQTSGPLGRISSRVHQIFYQDGTYIDLNAPLSFTWVGSSYSHLLVGVNYASNTFELGAGGNQITAGNASEGGSGDNTFVFGRGDGPSTVTLNGGGGIISLAPGLTQADIALRSNAAGDLTVVILDTGDTLTIKSDLFTSPWGVSSAVDHLQFSDGTKIQLGLVNFAPQPVTYSWVGLGDGQTLTGSPWGLNSFIVGPNNTNIIAGDGGPNGSLYGTNFNSFYWDEGDGNSNVVMNGGIGELHLSAAIDPSLITLQANAAGDLTVGILGDPLDTITFKSNIYQNVYGVASRIQKIDFADGTSEYVGETNPDAGTNLPFTWLGSATNSVLTGSGFGSNNFILAPGGQHIIGGNGSQGGSTINNILFDRGDGNAVVDLNGGQAILTLGADIMRTSVYYTIDPVGDITVGILGDATDSIVFNSAVRQGIYGVNSSLGTIKFGDGTSQLIGVHSYQDNPITLTWFALPATTQLTGSGLEANLFDLTGRIGASGTLNITGGNGSQGGSNLNTVNYGLGNGNVVVDLNGGQAVLNLSADISRSNVYYTADRAGDITVNIQGDPADSIVFNGSLKQGIYGLNSSLGAVNFGDGTTQIIGVHSYQENPITLTWFASPTTTQLTGSGFEANLFDLTGHTGSADPLTITPGTGDQGGSNLNTYKYGLGDGNVVVDSAGASGILVLGPGISQSDLLVQTSGVDGIKLTFLNDTSDSLTFNHALSNGIYGVNSALGTIQFSDGSTKIFGVHSYVENTVTFTEVGSTDNTVLTGSDFGMNVFQFGPADTNGNGDTASAGTLLYAGNAANKFYFGLGDGHAQVDMRGNTGLLFLGAGIQRSDIIYLANAAGDLTVSFRNDVADSITFKGDLVQTDFGPSSAVQYVNYSDGSYDQIGTVRYYPDPMKFTYLGTTVDSTYTSSTFGNSAFELSVANDTIVSTGNDTVAGGSGNDTVHANGSSLLIHASTGNTVLDGSANVTADLSAGSLTYEGTGTAAITVNGSASVAANSGAVTVSTTQSSLASLIFGSADVIAFSNGNDAVQLGGGSATVNEGSSATDIYTLLFGSSTGAATINGFKSGFDLLHLSGFAQGEVQNALDTAVVANGSTSLSFSNGEHLTLAGVSNLGASSFA